MLVNLFDIEGKKVVPGIACYQIPWLKRIMTKYPDCYLQVYEYLCWTTCPDGLLNPYVNVEEDQKEDIILRDLGQLKFSLEDPIIIDTIEKCQELYETPVYRAYLGAKKMLDKVGRYLGNEQITDGKDGNAAAVDRFLTKLPEYWETYRKLESVLKEEQSKVKGSVAIPYHQLGNYKETKEYE